MFSNFFELIGKLKVDREYSTERDKFGYVADWGIGYVADWGITKSAAALQFEHEKTNPKPLKKIMVAELTTKSKWWKFW